MTKPGWEDDDRICDLDDAIYSITRVTNNSPENEARLNHALKKTLPITLRFQDLELSEENEKKAHTFVHIGAIYARLGETNSARLAYDKASSLNSEDLDLPEHISDEEIDQMDEPQKTILKRIKISRTRVAP